MIAIIMHIARYLKYLIAFFKKCEIKQNFCIILSDSLFESEWVLNLVKVDYLLLSEFLSSLSWPKCFSAFLSASGVVLLAYFHPMNLTFLNFITWKDSGRGVSAHSIAVWILCFVQNLPFSYLFNLKKIAFGILELPGNLGIDVCSSTLD